MSLIPGGLSGSAVMYGGSVKEGTQAGVGGGVILGSSVWEITVKFLVSQKFKAGQSLLLIYGVKPSGILPVGNHSIVITYM